MQSVRKSPGGNRKGATMRNTETLLEIKKPKERLAHGLGALRTMEPTTPEKAILTKFKTQERQQRLRPGQMEGPMHQPEAVITGLGQPMSKDGNTLCFCCEAQMKRTGMVQVTTDANQNHGRSHCWSRTRLPQSAHGRHAGPDHTL